MYFEIVLCMYYQSQIFKKYISRNADENEFSKFWKSVLKI